MNDRRFDGKSVLVTGAGSGIGLQAARDLASEGALLTLFGRDEKRLVEAAELTGSKDVMVVAGDVSQPNDVRRLASASVERFKSIDVLINAAGIVRRDQKLCDVDDDEWDRHLAVNLKGAFLTAKYTIPHMQKAGGGSIVNISSQLAFVAAPKYPAYCAAKAGVVGLSRSIALDYGIDRIRANCVCPGLTETPMAHVQRANFDAIRADVAAKHPLGRIGTPSDISAAILYLASDEASWITGQSLIVDGGWTVQ